MLIQVERTRQTADCDFERASPPLHPDFLDAFILKSVSFSVTLVIWGGERRGGTRDGMGRKAGR